ncbi:MAG: hypothetical protein HYU58_19540 [Proteobacteria bacterium]|nr:hypothetical protein [Pseudomonadota bacterium]
MMRPTAERQRLMQDHEPGQRTDRRLHAGERAVGLRQQRPQRRGQHQRTEAEAQHRRPFGPYSREHALGRRGASLDRHHGNQRGADRKWD